MELSKPHINVVNMFSRKFNLNGKSIKKVMPVARPTETKANSINSDLTGDVSHLDFMGIEDFISITKEKIGCNDTQMWNAACDLAGQLKESRALLSLASYLSSNDGLMSIIDRLIDTAYLILNAENIYLLQIDPNGELVVTHSRIEEAVGSKFPQQEFLAGACAETNPDFICTM